MTKKDLYILLDKIQFGQRFYENFWQREYTIGYEQGHKIIPFTTYNSFANVDYRIPTSANKPKYNNNENLTEEWYKFFEDLSSKSERDILSKCVKIIDWGGIAGSTNDLYELTELSDAKKLKKYLIDIKYILDNEDINLNDLVNNPHDFNIYFSSGWTKIYSFLNNRTVVYDSRFQAFLNHILVFNYDLSIEKNRKNINLIFNQLFNPSDLAKKRKRNINSRDLGLKFSKKKKNSVNGVCAQMLSSWMILYLVEHKKNNNLLSFKEFDNKFFMLGFDLAQISTLPS
jgi:hypothetical protein